MKRNLKSMNVSLKENLAEIHDVKLYWSPPINLQNPFTVKAA